MALYCKGTRDWIVDVMYDMFGILTPYLTVLNLSTECNNFQVIDYKFSFIRGHGKNNK